MKTQLHINNNAILERNWPYYIAARFLMLDEMQFSKTGGSESGTHNTCAYLPFIYLLLILLCSLLWLNYYHEYWSQTSRQMQIKINHYWYSFKGRHKGGLFLESCFKGDWSKHRAPCFGKKWLCKYQFQNWDQLLLKINRTDATSDCSVSKMD